jgi:hypothetical protein
MMEQQTENPFKMVLLRLEKVSEEVSRVHGYTSEVEQLKIIVELIREQVQDENTSHSDR